MDNTYDFFALFIKRSFTVRVLISTAVLAVSLFSIPDVGLAQPRYTLTDLGTLGGARSQAHGVNDSGQVVGASDFEPNNDNYHPFLWENHEMIDLVMVGDGSKGRAEDINNFGQVVGWQAASVDGTNYNVSPLLWEWEDGGMTGPSTLSHNAPARCKSINDSGQIVGFSSERAVMWNGQDGMQDLGTLGGEDSESRAYGINRLGHVVGKSEFEGGGYQTNHAFLWQDGEMTDLGILPGGDWKYSHSWAFDINKGGQVVGRSYVGSSHAFLWEDEKMTDLGTLEEDSSSSAYAINNAGQAVGYSQGYSQGSGRVSNAVLWNDGEIHNLNDLVENDLGMRLDSATDINNHGQIVGGGYIGDDLHAFLLTPVPEPASLISALIGVGAIGLIAAARRRRRQG